MRKKGINTGFVEGVVEHVLFLMVFARYGVVWLDRNRRHRITFVRKLPAQYGEVGQISQAEG